MTEQFFEGVKYVGGIAGALTAIIACSALFFKPIRKGLVKAFGSNKAQLAMLRNDITNIYYKYLPTKTLPVYVRENLVYLNTAYVELGGNSYVCTIVKDMLTWDVSST